MKKKRKQNRTHLAEQLLTVALDTDDMQQRTLLRLAANELDPDLEVTPSPQPEPEPVVDAHGTPITVGCWVMDVDSNEVVRVEEIDRDIVGDDMRGIWHRDAALVEFWPNDKPEPEWFYEPHRMLWVNRDGLTIYDDEAKQLGQAMFARAGHIIRNGEPVQVGPL